MCNSNPEHIFISLKLTFFQHVLAWRSAKRLKYLVKAGLFFLHKNSIGDCLFHIFMQGILPFTYSIFVGFLVIKIEI